MSSPLYQTHAQRMIGVLQQWQTLLAPCRDATTVMAITLADVQAAILALQQTFGPVTTLETIIQVLVARDLRDQLEQRLSTSYKASVA